MEAVRKAFDDGMRRVERDTAHRAWEAACGTRGDAARVDAFLSAAALWEAFALRYDDPDAARYACKCFSGALAWDDLTRRHAA